VVCVELLRSSILDSCIAFPELRKLVRGYHRFFTFGEIRLNTKKHLKEKRENPMRGLNKKKLPLLRQPLVFSVYTTVGTYFVITLLKDGSMLTKKMMIQK